MKKESAYGLDFWLWKGVVGFNEVMELWTGYDSGFRVGTASVSLKKHSYLDKII